MSVKLLDEDYEALRKERDELKKQHRKIFETLLGWFKGLPPVSCDGKIIVDSDDYNKLVDAVNKGAQL